MMTGEFSVYQFFPDDSYEKVLHFVDAETAVTQARRLTGTLGARMGTTRRIIITDGGDCTVFDWKFGEGRTWSPPELLAEEGDSP
jgi:hypothetical protein